MRNKIKRSFGERAFSLFNYLFFILIMLITLYPVWHIVCASFSNAMDLLTVQGLILKPVNFTTEAYKYMTQNPMIFRSYMNTLFIVVVGVTINIFFTSVAAYFLSRRNVLFKKPIMVMIVFTMYFSGGLIPFCFTIKDLGLENSLWALIVPTAVNTFNLIIMRTSFSSIPHSLDEAARIDGAGHWTILFRIVYPVSKAIIAVMILYYAVEHWNAWFNAMLFLSDRKLFPLQLILQEILIRNDTRSMTTNLAGGDNVYISETIKYAVIVVATVPILCIYPFIQKYFVGGVMLGAVKE